MNLKVLGVLFSLAIVLVGAATAWVGFKSKSEIEARTGDPWRGANSTRWVEVTAEKNPDLWLASPKDIAEGRDPVRPIREPVYLPALQTITTTWPDRDMSTALATPHSKEEPPHNWLDRHFSTVETAREFAGTRR